jgi:hypothetical protein
VQKLKTTRIIKPITPYDKQIKMWTRMTNQTLQTRDFREYFMLPGERCNSIMYQTHFNRPPWLTPGSCQISTELQDRLQPLLGPSRNVFGGPIYAASRSDNENDTVRIYTRNVFRETSEIQPPFSRPPERQSPMRIHGLRLVRSAS